MLQRFAIALCFACTCLPTAATAAGSGRHVVIVLDASRQMAGPLAAAGAPGEPRWTRLGAAREAVSGTLLSLASEEKHAVALVLAGRPVATQSKPLTEADLPGYEATLDALLPGGEAPILEAIERAVALAPADKSMRKTQIVVVTSGQSETTTAADRLLEALHVRHAAVSIIHLGNADEDRSLDELRLIAAESGGEFHQPTTAREVRQAAISAVTRDEPRRIASLQPQPVTAVFQEPPAQPLPEAMEEGYDILFEVTYYGIPVKDAEVIIHGDNFDLIYDREAEYNKPSLRANRLAGKYLFKGVPLGSYTMEITANVKNRTYQVIRGFSADDDNKIPGVSFKIQLEKSKDQPPPPPPAP